MTIQGIQSQQSTNSSFAVRNLPQAKVRGSRRSVLIINGQLIVANNGNGPRSIAAREKPVNVPAMKKQLKIKDPAKRLAAVKALGQSKDKNAVLPLIPRITDSNKKVRTAAWKALQSLYAIPAIKAHVDSGIAFIRIGLQHKDVQTRKAYAYALGIFKDKGSVPALRKLLGTKKDFDVASAAVWSLAEMGASDKATITALGTSMHRAVARFSRPPARGRLIMLRHDDPALPFLKSVAKALIRLKQSSVVDVFYNKLVKVDLVSKYQPTRVAAVAALATIGGAKAWPILLKRLKVEPHYTVRSTIVFFMNRAKYKGGLSTYLKMLKKDVVKNGHVYDRIEIRDYLFRLARGVAIAGGPKMIPELRKLLDAPLKMFWQAYRKIGVARALIYLKDRNIYRDLIKRINHKHYFERSTFISIIADETPVEAINPLIKRLAKETDPTVLKAIFVALMCISKKHKAHSARIKKAISLYRAYLRCPGRCTKQARELRRKLLELAK